MYTIQYLLVLLLFRNGTYFEPGSLRFILTKLHADYPSVDVHVTSVGVHTSHDDVRDTMRVDWIRRHADETLKSMSDQLFGCLNKITNASRSQ